MKEPNTYGILDKCICGAKACFYNPIGNAWYVECTECAESTLACKSKGEAMVEWNKDMRERR